MPAGLRPGRRGGLRRARPADPAGHRRPALRDRVEVGLPVPLPGRRPDAGRPGAASPATPPTSSPRSAPAGLNSGVARRRERRLEDRLRRCAAGRRSRCWTATTTSGTPRRWRTSRSPAATMRFLVPGTDGGGARTASTCWSGPPTDPAARAQVDSGRLAEPFWYVDSPLTTPDDRTARSPGGRPAGDVPVARARACSCPTCPVTVAGRPDVVRLRAAGPRGRHRAARGRRADPPPCRSRAAACRSPCTGIARPRRRTRRCATRSAPAPTRSGCCAPTRTSPPCSPAPPTSTRRVARLLSRPSQSPVPA